MPAPPSGDGGRSSGVGHVQVDAAVGQPRNRVERRAVLADLEVQVDAGAVAGGALKTDECPDADSLAGGDGVGRQVAVAGGDAAAVVELDEVAVAGQVQVAVAVAVGAGAGGGDDGAVGGRVHG